MLNIIWAFFFISAFFAACYQTFVSGNYAIWDTLVNTIFTSAKGSFTIAINLTGILCFWLGLLKIAEKSGITEVLARGLRPLFARIMPEVPANSPAIGSIVMNMAANMLGLDNAATPMGLKAMEQLQELNPKKDTASNAQVLFMVINSSAVTLIPISIFMYRAESGSLSPSAVFIPILLATSCSTLVGFISVGIVQKLNLLNRVVLSYLLGLGLIVCLVAFGFLSLPAHDRSVVSSAVGNFILFGTIISFITLGLLKKQQVYDDFVEGAKEGFGIAVSIIPYLVAMLVGVAVFRDSGILDMILFCFKNLFAMLNMDTEFVAALPTAIMKPLSGSGSRAMMLETMKNYGADSFPAFVSSIIQGSTETTFYVLAVYFGAVKISKIRSALPCALLADFAGIVAAIVLGYVFYSD